MLTFDGPGIATDQVVQGTAMLRFIECAAGDLIGQHIEVIGDDRVDFPIGPDAAPSVAHVPSISAPKPIDRQQNADEHRCGPMLTAFEYMYRDAGNFKAYGTVLLEGAVDAADKQLICGRLDSRELFIAEQVNVPALYEQLYQWSDGPTQSDHCWHEFIGFHEIASAPDAATVQAKEFIARFAAVDEWDETLSPHFRLADPLDPNRCRAFT